MVLNTKRIVITGGPGTGKSSIINELSSRGYLCYEEVSRQVIIAAQKEGIEQLFLTEPLKFSELLLEARIEQYKNAANETHGLVFLDRGIPDVLAYMDYANSAYPPQFKLAAESHTYDKIYVLAPWKDIFVSDNERYENFDQAQQIHEYLLKGYKRFGYNLIDVPFGSIAARTDYILNDLNQ